VETAVSGAGERQQQSLRALHHLVPVAAPEAVSRLLGELVPQARFPELDWQPLHPRAWRRMAFWPLLGTLLLALLLALAGTAWALLPLALLPVWAWRARGLARRAGFALDAHVVAWRSGWLDRRVSFAEVAKLQGVRLLASPFDRRRGMASVVVDTAGAGAFGHRIHMRFLPEAVARRVAAELAARIARSPLAWCAALLSAERGQEQHQQREHCRPSQGHREGADPHRGVADGLDGHRHVSPAG